jgi:hypothetical protein
MKDNCNFNKSVIQFKYSKLPDKLAHFRQSI